MTERKINYACTVCNEPKDRDALIVKRIQFREMGVGGKVIKTRVIAWLCTICLSADPDNDIPAYETAPGTDAKKYHEGEVVT